MFNQNLAKYKNNHHKYCFFNSGQLDIELSFDEKGDLQGCFFCDEKYQGYTGLMHGGISSAILDSAMTRCLFGNGIAAYTAELKVKYHLPLKINLFAELTANIKTNHLNKVYELEAVIFQESEKKISAKATFFAADDLKNKGVQF